MQCHTMPLMIRAYSSLFAFHSTQPAMHRMWIEFGIGFSVGVGSAAVLDALCNDPISTASILGCEIGWK